MKKIIFGIFALLILSGCSSTGEDKFSSSYVKSHIIAHRTTQSEVQAIYGVPDGQDVHSDGSTTWRYDKSGNLGTASTIVSYIPGASTVSSALGMAQTANSTSENATKASDKLSGNTEYHARSLYVSFGDDKVVSSWSM